MNDWLDEITWNKDGLVPAIAQDHISGTVLMMAWMNRESLRKTIETREAVYWSRSRGKLWHKGESSGNTQKVHEIFIDCDADTVMLKVEQVGGIACHTGRAHCFFRRLTSKGWQNTEPVLKDPSEIYAKQP